MIKATHSLYKKIFPELLVASILIVLLILISFLVNGISNAGGVNIVEYPLPNGSAANSIVTGPDGNLWSTFHNGNLTKINPDDGSMTEYAIDVPGNPRPKDVIVGPDNNLWFLVNSTSRYLAKAVLNDSVPTFTYYPVLGNNLLSSLVVGPNNNFWYSDWTGGRVYVVDSLGQQVRSSYYIGGGVQGIVFDENGDAWLGNSIDDVVQKLDPDTGNVTDYTTAGVVYPVVELLGSDGNVWFSNLTTSEKLGRITPSGDITLWTPSGAPSGAINGPDGHIWFGMKEVGIAKIDPNTEIITEYATPLEYVFGLTNGPNNDIWYNVLNYGSLGAIGHVDLGIDNSDPQVSIISPSSNSYIDSNGISVTVSSSDDGEVAKVELYSDGELIASEENPNSPHVFNWDVSAEQDGKKKLTAKAYDNAGKTSLTDEVKVYLDRSAPTVDLVKPNSGEYDQGSTITLKAEANDAVGVSFVQFKINGVNFKSPDTKSPYSIDWDTSNYFNESYEISAVATDLSGKSSTSNKATVEFEDSDDDDDDDDDEDRDEDDDNDRDDDDDRDDDFEYPDDIEAQIPDDFDLSNDDRGRIVATIREDQELSDLDYEVPENIVLIVDGVLGEVSVKKGAILRGNGKVKKLLIQIGAFLSPGKSPGCIESQDLKLYGVYEFQAGGKEPCAYHDQAIVSGEVEISGVLQVELENDFQPTEGDILTIISNDSEDAVIGGFENAPEGEAFTVDGVEYSVSYVGGDGNDVVLAVLGVSEVVATSDSVENSLQETKTDEAEETSSLRWLLIIGGVVLFAAAVAGGGLLYRKRYHKEHDNHVVHPEEITPGSESE